MPDEVVKPLGAENLMGAATPQDAASVHVVPAVPSAVPVEAAPAVVAAVEPKVELTSDVPSLLEDAGKAKPAVEAKDAPKEPAKEPEKIEVKPEGKPAEAVKPAEPEKSAVVEVPIEYKFELPANLKGDDAKISAFTDVLRDAKLPAEIGSEVGQKLLGMHAEAMTAYADQVAKDTLKNQHQAFNNWRAEERKAILADSVIGGSGHDTAMKAIARTRDALVPAEFMAPRKYDDGSPRLSEFEEFLRVTGAGDHRVFHRILHNASRYVDEPQSDSTPSNIKPPPSNGRAPGSFKETMYDNPRSNPNGRV